MPIRSIRNFAAFGPMSVECPRCSQRATLTQRGTSLEPDALFACPHCHASQRVLPPHQMHLSGALRKVGIAWVPAPAGYGGSKVSVNLLSPEGVERPEIIGFNLWIQIPCAGENLWFLNQEHLSLVLNSLRAPQLLDERTRRSESEFQKYLWIEPWIKVARNRDEIINRLQSYLDETQI